MPSTNTLDIRPMLAADWRAVSELIHFSTNHWYEVNRGFRVFACTPAECELFCAVYEGLDPNCCLVARDRASNHVIGSCFYHPRPTHVSLGIMNVHPSYAGRSVASALLKEIVRIGQAQNKPVRLVSSAMNLDSFSLYNRAGFVPRVLYQDMLMPKGVAHITPPPLAPRVRPATLQDVPAMVALELELAGLDRTKDFTYFISNEMKIWHTLVLEAPESSANPLAGFLISVSHPASTMLGPGVMRDTPTALALIHAQLLHLEGKTPVFLVPSQQTDLVQTLYAWQARNCEMHMHNVLGDFHPMRGVHMPTFMPETA